VARNAEAVFNMDKREDKSKIVRKRDYWSLTGAAGLGIIGTLKSFGVDGVTFPAAAFLAGAGILALLPMIRLFGKSAFLKENQRTVIAVIFAAHLIGTLFFFPPEEMINNRPVVTLDHAVHFYQVERAKEVFRDSFKFHTYDPYFMGGYPGGTIFDIDTKGAELWCSLLRFVDTARAFKLFIILGYLLIVFTVYSGCRRLGYEFKEAIYALLLFLAYWHWGRPYVGDFRYSGMFAYLFVSHLSFYLVGLFRSFLREEPSKRFYLLGPLTFFIHPTAVVFLPVSFIALFIAERFFSPQKRSYLKWTKDLSARMAGWCFLVVALNAVWLIPFFQYLKIKIPSETYFQIAGFGRLAAVIIKPGNLPALFLLVLSGIGFVRLLRQRRFVEAAAPAATSVFLLIIAGVGIYLPVFDQMEPGRFLVPAFLFMAPLAGTGFAVLIRESKKIFPAQRLFLSAKSTVVIILLLSSPVFALISSREYYKHILSTTFTPEVDKLLETLERETNNSGRLMIEDDPAWIYGDCYLASIIPLYTGVEQIGGLYPNAFIKHNFTNFTSFQTMGVPLKRMDPEKLRDYMKLYNIHWILTATRESNAYFDKFKEMKIVWASKHFVLRELLHKSSFASESGVEVHASYGELHVIITPETGKPPPEKILLKYHWDEGLDVGYPARISRVTRLDDPVPLILLEPNGETDIRIVFRWRI
jgi:hypothetical protein